MKYKKFVVAGVFLFLIVVVSFYYFCKESFQPSSSAKDILTILDSFCNQQYGEHWNIDSLVIYNEKLVFVVVQTKEHKIDLSIQPDIRTIIVEKMSPSSSNNKRIFRY